MPRPTKWRKIEHIPVKNYFSPEKECHSDFPENCLKLEELEAIRLKDLEGLEQGECAERMEISRPTFQRILLSAREKIADSLVHGKAIRIEGGDFTRQICPMFCSECGKEWKESYENLEQEKAHSKECPDCGSMVVYCKDHLDDFCDHGCRRNRGGRK